MIVDCGIDVNKYKIFAGRKGQRLAAQYGTGNDQPIAGQGWWNRPWLEVLLPHSINDGWYPNFRFSVADLGDGNLDGIRDIWTYSEPYLICYTTGEYLDQWVDGYFYLGGVWAVANLGDIDGSGKQTIALHYHRTPQPFTPFPGGIVFIKPNRELPRQYGGDPPLRLPHEEASVRGAPGTDDISFTLTRDRGSHRQMLALTNGTPGAQYTVQIVNQLGERIALYRLSAEQSHIDIDLPRGIYFVSIASRSGIRTHPLLVE
jgi:hypothetical protein